MVKFKEHIEKIKETKRQIAITESKKRKRDLRKHLYKLRKEYKEAKMYYSMKGTSNV